MRKNKLPLIYNDSDGDIHENGIQGDCRYIEKKSILRIYCYTKSHFT